MVSLWGTAWGNILMTFLISMVPVIELRGAIPAAVLAGLDIRIALITAIIGNLVPVPFIIIFIRKIFKWLQAKSQWLGNMVRRLEAKADAKKAQVLKYEFWGLMILVAIPLPGTGAWTGALVAALMDLRLKSAVPSIFCGVLLASVIVTCIVLGLFSL